MGEPPSNRLLSLFWKDLDGRLVTLGLLALLMLGERAGSVESLLTTFGIR